ncbi:MAG: hypothetical protein INF16_14080 [Methylobacterium sp.]|jgi:TPR repeat protein|nr:hypothetical protein [Methylobacterium sp.]MCA3635857.1 hypothetical protein [Methylobacterium sp.]MCA3637323.1 hypothetical protein [Methylobacterium sp.]
MAMMGLNGSGEPVANLFEKAVDFATGRSGALDFIEAHKWFNLAAMHGDAEAARRRQELAAEMAPVEVAQALRLAREWISTH